MASWRAGPAVTVTVTLAVAAPLVAVIVAVPTLTAVSCGPAMTATAGLELVPATEINAVTHLTNGPSQAVCRRIGMEHRGVVERWYDDPSEHFVITREQWQRAEQGEAST